MGEKIRKLRETAGMSQSALAAKIGVDTSSISLWENGKTYPSYANICKLAQALNCNPGDLF